MREKVEKVDGDQKVGKFIEKVKGVFFSNDDWSGCWGRKALWK